MHSLEIIKKINGEWPEDPAEPIKVPMDDFTVQGYINLVNKIWAAAGIQTFAEAGGKSLPEIVAELKVKADKYDAIIAEARSVSFHRVGPREGGK